MEGLPKGLVSTTSKVCSELDDLGAVELGHIIQLWKVYSANPSVHEGHIGHRLENFFWRTWSSEHLYRSMNGSKLARLFLRISEPSPFPLSMLQRSRKIQKKEAPLPKRRANLNALEQSSHASTSNKTPLPPILKKSSTPSESQKTTRLLLTSQEGESITRKPDNPPTPVPLPPPVVGSQSRPVQKRTHHVASKAKSIKRRPIVIRRKSSQTSSGGSTRSQSPQRLASRAREAHCQLAAPEESSVFEVPEISDGAAGESVGSPGEPPFEKRLLDGLDETASQPAQLPPAFVSNLKNILRNSNQNSPSQSTKSTPPKWGFVTTDDWTHYDVRYVCPENYEQPSSQSLVDQGFRSRFTERLHQEQENYASSLVPTGPGGMSGPHEASDYPRMASVGSRMSDMNSPSKLGNSNNAESSTAGTSIPILTPSHNSSAPLSSPSTRRTSTGFPPFTPLSLPRGRGQLSLMIEESRRKKLVEEDEKS